jgi:DNA-binding NarL/FixJ family response regulator
MLPPQSFVSQVDDKVAFVRIALPENKQPPASLVVEEKPICADAIALCLRSDCGVSEVRIESTMARAIAEEAESHLLVALVDLATVNYDFEGLRALAAQLDPCPVIAVDDRPNPAFSRIAETIKCRGYIAKTLDREQFARAIQLVISGQPSFLIDCADADGSSDRHHVEGGGVLTPRQRAVLAWIARGSSNEEIATELGISVGTVKTHVHTVLRRIGARNRTEAAIVAARFYALRKGRQAD